MKSKIIDKNKIDWGESLVIKFDESWINNERHNVKLAALQEKLEGIPKEKVKELLRYQLICQYRRINTINLLLSFYEFELNEEEIKHYMDLHREYFNIEGICYGLRDKDDDFETALRKESIYLIKKELVFEDIIKSENITLSDEELKERLWILKELDPTRHNQIIQNKQHFENYRNGLLLDKVSRFIWKNFPLKVLDGENKVVL